LFFLLIGGFFCIFPVDMGAPDACNDISITYKKIYATYLLHRHMNNLRIYTFFHPYVSKFDNMVTYNFQVAFA